MGVNSRPRTPAGQKNMKKSGEKRRDAGIALKDEALKKRGLKEIRNSERRYPPEPNKKKFGGRNNRRKREEENDRRSVWSGF